MAPSQISWLAFCNTTGFNTQDYILADKHLIYKNEYNLYSEKVVNLPNIWNAHAGFDYKRNLISLFFQRLHHQINKNLFLKIF